MMKTDNAVVENDLKRVLEDASCGRVICSLCERDIRLTASDIALRAVICFSSRNVKEDFLALRENQID